VKTFRQNHGLSPAEFGKLFRDADELPNGYTRPYISMLERGKVPITRRFEKNFERVRRGLRSETLLLHGAHPIELEIITTRKMPKRLHIPGEIKICARRRCPVCKMNHTRYFVPRVVHQKQHSLTKQQLKEWRAERRRKSRRRT
jgi:hypothetical protein